MKCGPGLIGDEVPIPSFNSISSMMRNDGIAAAGGEELISSSSRSPGTVARNGLVGATQPCSVKNPAGMVR